MVCKSNVGSDLQDLNLFSNIKGPAKKKKNCVTYQIPQMDTRLKFLYFINVVLLLCLGLNPCILLNPDLPLFENIVI